jgi:hydrogenase nickel incorporation protein HypA/HybF
MHEATLANSIVQTVLRHANQAGAKRVRSVTVELGEWTTYNPEQVGFWVKVGFEKTIARGARLFFKKVEGAIRCNSCGYLGKCPQRRDAMDPGIGPVLECPSCGQPDVEIVQGREAIVKAIKIDT